MMIAPIDALSAVGGLATNQVSSSSVSSPLSFADWMTKQLDEVQRSEKVAEQGLLDVATGNADNLHQVMINLEQAKLSFQLLLQVRNRALEAYQEVMRMQI